MTLNQIIDYAKEHNVDFDNEVLSVLSEEDESMEGSITEPTVAIGMDGENLAIISWQANSGVPMSKLSNVVKN